MCEPPCTPYKLYSFILRLELLITKQMDDTFPAYSTQIQLRKHQ